jgi:hypothetical protein
MDFLFPLRPRYPIEGIAAPIVELGFGMVQVLEMEGGLVRIFQIILMLPNINEVVF